MPDTEVKSSTTEKPPAPAPTPTEPSKPAASPSESAEGNPNRSFQLKDLDKVTVTLGGKPIELWIMDTSAKQAEGMMFLTDKEVRDDQGMIFAFAKPETNLKNGFYMKNTILPLDIVFISPQKKVINIQKGKPHDETNLPSAAVYQYVIELKQGQAQALGLKPGSSIPIPASVKGEEENPPRTF